VELNVAESAQIASRPGQGNAALEALIATAQRTTPPPQPQALEIEEVPTRRPLQASEAGAAPQRTRTRNRGNVNGVRRRPRPQGGQAGDERRGGPREEPVATLERYSHKNEDGSFTFGYVAADGSFREETRGTDCITRGKYGYIDPEGVKREYSYTSGLACEEGEGNEDDLQNLEGERVIEDTVDPKERFRQTVSEQLTADQIPQAARPRRPIQRRPQEPAPARQESAQDSQFANFGAGRQNVPQRRPAPRPRPQAAPAPRPAPVPARPQTQAQGSFDFDAELDGFTLNRPALSFEAANQAAANPSSFSSSIAFNQNTGTFQTSLQQNVAGQSLNVQNAAAPQGTTRAPQTTFQTTAAPLTTVPVTTAAPSPVTEQPRSVPAAAQTIPAGTFKLDFQPLNIPQNLPQAPKPAPQAPRPAPQAVPQPVVRQPVATPQAVPAARPAPQPVPNQPANTFFVFQPFGQNQPQPAPGATPVPSAVNHNAFRLAQPQASAVPGAIRAQPVQSRPVPVQSVPRPQQPQQVAPKAAPAPVQARPAPVRAAPVQARPAPVRPAPAQPAQAPQLQFGFQPVSQTRPGQPLQQRPAPFTAFGGGAPRPRPQQLGVPPQLQSAQPQFAQFDSRFRPQAPAQAGQPQLRQPQFQPGSASVFNPLQAFRGA